MKFNSSYELAKAIRKKSLQMVVSSRASHIGSALSITDILSVLYFDILNINKIFFDFKFDLVINGEKHRRVSTQDEP